MRAVFFLVIFNFIFLISNTFAQQKKVDSILSLIEKDNLDTTKVKHLNSLSWLLKDQNPDTSIFFSKQALDILTPKTSIEFPFSDKIIEENTISILRAKTMYQLGALYQMKGDYTQALDYSLKTLDIANKQKDKKLISSCLSKLGNIYTDKANYPSALDYYLKALKLEIELKNNNNIAWTLTNIGSIYLHQNDFKKALEYHFNALKINEELKNKNGIMGNHVNIGIVFYSQKDYTKAIEYYNKALKTAEEDDNKNVIVAILGNIGNIYHEQKDFENALNCDFKALKISEELGNQYYTAGILCNIGEVYTKTGKFKEAENYLKKAIELNKKMGTLDFLMESERIISEMYDLTGRHKDALIHYKNSVALKDSIYSEENKKQLISKEMNFQFEKKEAILKAEHDKEMAIAEEKKTKQQIIIWSIIGLLLLVVMFLGYIFRSLRITRKQKQIIEVQKNEVLAQKEIVDKQKQKIVDSITYAQRIQKSILMDESEIQNYLPECFIYFQPKDIVSGDFYWFSKSNDKIIIAAVDCTGHGVPGAFMSMIGNTLLNQIVNEKKITTPSEILEQLNTGIYKSLHQDKEDALSDDGMDIALCVINYKKNEIEFAGAGNSLYVISDEKLETLTAEPFGIGGTDILFNQNDTIKKEFTNHTISIKKDMSIYLFSDGYLDQFGGPEKRKFGTQRFKELLLENQHLSMKKQKEAIDSVHSKWKADLQQIDDILIIGIRL